MAVPYSSNGIEATIFIRSVKPELTAKKLVKESVSVVKQLEKDGKYTKLKLYESDGKGERPGWVKAAFTARSDGAPFLSLTYVKVAKDHLIKVRATSPLPVDKNIMKFIEELQTLIDAAIEPTKAKKTTEP